MSLPKPKPTAVPVMMQLSDPRYLKRRITDERRYQLRARAMGLDYEVKRRQQKIDDLLDRLIWTNHNTPDIA